MEANKRENGNCRIILVERLCRPPDLSNIRVPEKKYFRCGKTIVRANGSHPSWMRTTDDPRGHVS